MAKTHNGVIEDATGDLLQCGYCTFSPGVGETQRTDCPHPGKRRGDTEETMMTRWTGTEWVEVAQPI